MIRTLDEKEAEKMATSTMQELIFQGRAEGETKVIATVLKARFGTVPQIICDTITGYSDPVALESLAVHVATCKSLDEFRKELK